MAVKKKAVTKRAPTKKKAVTKKRVGTSQTKASTATKKAPSKRLKKRRAKNTAAGYYPNPIFKRKPKPTPTRTPFVVGFVHDDKTWFVTATVSGIPMGASTDERDAMQFMQFPLARRIAVKLRSIRPDDTVFARVTHVR